MKIVLPGGTGQVGTVLARSFHKGGDEVVVLSRGAQSAGVPWRVLAWDAKSPGEWASEFEGADAVINLAGRSVNCRYSASNRRAIMESRVNSARVVGEAIERAASPPRVWLQMSTATIYAHRFDAANDEATGIIGGAERDAPDSWRFSIDVATAWERVVDETVAARTRKVKMRAAVIMSPDAGGVFETLLRLVRFGLGGQSGDGRQFVSWIHAEDFVRSVRWLIEHDELAGAINLAAPHPLPNAEFMRALREAWGVRVGLPASRLMLEAGALLLRSETELILKSRRVVPRTLLESGFEFRFPTWPEAARDLCRRYRGVSR
ncbi:MAG: uncharacterized protein QOD32_621 [Pyrinomonadaceae bacterium]|jgi:uncharacterized protein (TIGR01777 family)|nr:uncharacterized protein [Pyrinomonadaceae bacterium]